jgi:drug/metabolite transporter (DMT)-like permease
VTRRGFLLFAALGVAWGIPYLLIKIAVGELDPAMVVLGRTVVGTVLLLPLALFRHEIIPVLKRWRPLLAYTVVEIVLPWFFLSSAEQRLPSSTSGLLLAAVPLAGIAIAFVFGRPERLHLANWLGILLGMIGVAALVGLDVAGSDLIGVAELVVTVIGYALGPAILARWMSDLPGIGVVTTSLGIAAIIYIPVVLLTGAVPTALPSPPVWISVLLLGAICSALAFVLMFALVGEIGPVRATTITYVNPAVAIVAGAIVLHERVTWVTIVGFVLVLGGSFLAARKRGAPPPAPEAPPATGPVPTSAPDARA